MISIAFLFTAGAFFFGEGLYQLYADPIVAPPNFFWAGLLAWWARDLAMSRRTETGATTSAATDALVAELRAVIADLRQDRDHWRGLPTLVTAGFWGDRGRVPQSLPYRH
jgi:hypothetical protein